MSDKNELDKLLGKYVDEEKVKEDIEKLEKEKNKPRFSIKELQEKARKRKG